MAIGSLTVDWLVRLHERGLLPPNASFLDLGPQDLSFRAALLDRAARRLGHRAEAADALFDGDWRYASQLSFYELFGARSYAALDLFDPRAAIVHDLNDPLDTAQQFDVICDFGTIEHVFNIGQGFSSLHRLLAPGGLLLCAPPSYGFINHGFYTINPVLFTQLAMANAYDVVDYHYVDNWFVRCAERDQAVDQPFDFDSLPIRLEDMQDLPAFMTKVALQFQANLASRSTQERTGKQPYLVFDLSLAALRKTAASPDRFINPQQGVYDGETALQAQRLRSSAPSASAPRRNIPVFDASAHRQHIDVVSCAAIDANGERTATLLRDKSPEYATLFQDFSVDDDDRMHTFAIDLKAGDSPLVQIVMAFLGGEQRIYHAFVETDVMSVTGEGLVGRERLGQGWFRIALRGANNASGNKSVRLQIYPRHGRPEDVGSVYIANARLDP
jgi:SAM-dependent methyltransferase